MVTGELMKFDIQEKLWLQLEVTKRGEIISWRRSAVCFFPVLVVRPLKYSIFT